MTDHEDTEQEDFVTDHERATEERLRDYQHREVVDTAKHGKSAKESVVVLLRKVMDKIEVMPDDDVEQVVDQVAAAVAPDAPCPRCALDSLVQRFILELSNPVGNSGEGRKERS